MVNGPQIDSLRRLLAGHAPYRAPREDTAFEAAVLLLLRSCDPVEMLVIERAEIEGDPWSGHMALPGGRREPGDEDLLATALRETMEETGIAVERPAILGKLDEVSPATRRVVPLVIAPYVAVVPAETEARPDPREVQRAIWIPVPALASEDAVSEILIELDEGPRAFPSLTYEENVIWGLTHRILTRFLRLAGEAGMAGG